MAASQEVKNKERLQTASAVNAASSHIHTRGQRHTYIHSHTYIHTYTQRPGQIDRRSLSLKLESEARVSQANSL